MWNKFSVTSSTSVPFNSGSAEPQGCAKHVVGFRELGFREGSSFFRGIDFLLQCVDVSLSNFQITVQHPDSKQTS